MSGQTERALDLCSAHNVTIDETVAERIASAPRETDAVAEAKRVDIFMKLGAQLSKQGSHHLAAKIFTQAGDRVKAMKSLIRSGDTRRIENFAAVSRHKDVYVLCANYLQNLDWHVDVEIQKKIVHNYTKAKAFEQLAGFYDACAQGEVDEHRDYDKALAYLREAAAAAAKGQGGASLDSRLAAAERSVSLVERFIAARALVRGDPEVGTQPRQSARGAVRSWRPGCGVDRARA